MKTRIIKSSSYNEELIRKKITKNIFNIIEEGDKVLLKPNLLALKSPEEIVTTNPNIVKIVAERVRERGGKPIIFDAPGGLINNLLNKKVLKKLYRITGMKKVSEETGAELYYDTGSKYYHYPKGKLTKGFELITIIDKVDKIINLPKIKTHTFMGLTCAVKNWYGLLPPRKKLGYHSKMAEPEVFGKMLLDLAGFINPDITIVDGIIGMEGNGPSGGNPKKIGVIITGSDEVEIDSTVAKIIGMPLSIIPYLNKDVKVGDEYLVKDFKQPHTSFLRKFAGFAPKFLRNIINNFFVVKPIINKECVGCGVCRDNCPVSAIKMKEGKAVINQNKCIRCYCCHELCPHKAVSLKNSLL